MHHRRGRTAGQGVLLAAPSATSKMTRAQGKSGLESVLQDDEYCDGKENRTFQNMVVRAVKK